MAGNLTQVRDFTEISAATRNGDFTRFIMIEASGEIDPLNMQTDQMVFNLRDSNRKNTVARELARSKSKFGANLSHGIRCAGVVINI